jgi:hypothetical protein
MDMETLFCVITWSLGVATAGSVAVIVTAIVLVSLGPPYENEEYTCPCSGGARRDRRKRHYWSLDAPTLEKKRRGRRRGCGRGQRPRRNK